MFGIITFLIAGTSLTHIMELTENRTIVHRSDEYCPPSFVFPDKDNCLTVVDIFYIIALSFLGLFFLFAFFSQIHGELVDFVLG
jgi:hypothetical protein